MSTARSEHILIVDDDNSLRLLLRGFLEPEGYVVHEAASGQDVLNAIKKENIDLITLDLNLKGEDGLALARSLRRQCSVPIIMITAKSDEIDRIVGLEVGADDYIAKPFNVREVLARIRAVLRRYQTSQVSNPAEHAEVIVFGPWQLNLTARVLMSASGEIVPLTTAEFKLLELLITRSARVLTRESIIELLKGRDATAFDRSIDTLIGRLRKKIEPDPANPVFIKTVHGAGYVFVR